MKKGKKNDGEKVKSIIADAGGQIIGRTKLQKIAYLLEVAGMGDGFHFEYHHYGPYSEDLTRAVSIAHMAGEISEEKKVAAWGGHYSIYETSTTSTSQENDGIRQRLAKTAVKADAVVLELAATATYFAENDNEDPWAETKARKPDKADGGRLEKAQELYKDLRNISEKLPAI